MQQKGDVTGKNKFMHGVSSYVTLKWVEVFKKFDQKSKLSFQNSDGAAPTTRLFVVPEKLPCMIHALMRKRKMELRTSHKC
jgi:hypothetical protein